MNNDPTVEQDYFMDDTGGDDFQADFEPEEESELVSIQKAASCPSSQTNISHVIATSSHPQNKRAPQRAKNAVKRYIEYTLCIFIIKSI